MTLLEESPRRANADLQVVVIRPRPQPHLLDLRHVLVLLRVPRALVLFELEFAEIGNTTHGWICRRGDFDQIQTDLFGASNCVLE